MYELCDKYVKGFNGHGGPYEGLDFAIQSAKERLAGNRNLIAVYIWDRKLETYIGKVEWHKEWCNDNPAVIKWVML